MKKILVVAVHPDDETLACAGTLLKHKEAGDQIHWLIVTKVDQKAGYSDAVCSKREEEIKQVTKRYAFESVTELPFITTCLDQYTLNELVNAIFDVVTKIKPDTLYLPNRSDVHSDHRIAFEAAYSCTKPFRHPYIKHVYMMEALSETELAVPLEGFLPNTFVDISAHIDEKINIMSIFESEIGIHPFPRSEIAVRSLARFRGASSGFEYAEAFVLLRSRVD